MIALATTGPSAYWYLTRATGTVALLLLTFTVALGVANIREVHRPRLPRFVIGAIHRNASLLAVVFLVIHIVTSLLDGYAPLRLLDVVIPFGSAYRPLWVGFGAVAFDLLIAVTITSLLRRRLGYRLWRATHWAAYACWPVAVLHGLGTGSDAKTIWMLVLTAGCVTAVVTAVIVRVTSGWPDHAGARLSGLAASAMLPLGLFVWLPSGPLAPGWAQRAGTPSSLLRASASTATSSPTSAGGAAGPNVGPVRTTFSAPVSGVLHQAQLDDNIDEVHLSLNVAGQGLRMFGVRIYGHPISGGGLQMTTSRVELGTASDPTLYRGHVTALAGTTIDATVSTAAGASLTLQARLQLDPHGQTAGGTLRASPAGAGAP